MFTHNFRHKKIYIKESPIEGTGIFAKKNIQKGETVSRIRGKIVFWFVVDNITSTAGPNWIGFNKNKWIDTQLPYNMINHSCNPNVGIKGTRTVLALRNIKKGEEIVIDYSITEDDMLWKLPQPCKCGSKNCRNTIRSIQHLPQKTYTHYLPCIPKYFQNVYSKTDD